jgi:hypothetical protein
MHRAGVASGSAPGPKKAQEQKAGEGRKPESRLPFDCVVHIAVLVFAILHLRLLERRDLNLLAHASGSQGARTLWGAARQVLCPTTAAFMARDRMFALADPRHAPVSSAAAAKVLSDELGRLAGEGPYSGTFRIRGRLLNPGVFTLRASHRWQGCDGRGRACPALIELLTEFGRSGDAIVAGWPVLGIGRNDGRKGGDENRSYSEAGTSNRPGDLIYWFHIVCFCLLFIERAFFSLHPLIRRCLIPALFLFLPKPHPILLVPARDASPRETSPSATDS